MGEGLKGGAGQRTTRFHALLPGVTGEGQTFILGLASSLDSEVSKRLNLP